MSEVTENLTDDQLDKLAGGDISDEAKPQRGPRPFQKPHICNECGHRWSGGENICPNCGSTKYHVPQAGWSGPIRHS